MEKQLKPASKNAKRGGVNAAAGKAKSRYNARNPEVLSKGAPHLDDDNILAKPGAKIVDELPVYENGKSVEYLTALWRWMLRRRGLL